MLKTQTHLGSVGIPFHFNVNKPEESKELVKKLKLKDNDKNNKPKENKLKEIKQQKVLELDPVKKYRKRDNSDHRCFARVATGDQCKRSQTEDGLCSCHVKKLPYGRVDGPLEGKFLVKKRGPRFRNQSSSGVSDENRQHYIATQLIKIDEELYLIDELGLLYSNDKYGEIKGRRLQNEIHWYS